MRLNDIIRDQVSHDPDVVTENIIAAVRGEVLHVEDLRPAIRAYVAGTARTLVRETEQQAVDGPVTVRKPLQSRPAGRHTEPYVNVAQQAMTRLLAERCYVPGQGMVPWGMMTADMHRQRAEYLTRVRDAYASGMNATIARHRAAANLLDDTGFSDLGRYVASNRGLPDGLQLEPAT